MSEFLLKPGGTNPLVDAIRQAVGAGPDEEVVCATPTFERPAGWEPAMIAPSDNAAWNAFQSMTAEQLRSWGCRAWGGFSTEPPADGRTCAPFGAMFYPLEDDDTEKRTETHVLYLFPATWYDSIPKGFPIVDINGALEDFEPGKTDDDRRYGLLAYGVMIRSASPPAPKE